MRTIVYEYVCYMIYLQSDVRAGPLWHPPNNRFTRDDTEYRVYTPDVNSVVVPVSMHFCLPSSITWYVTPERSEDRIKVQAHAVFKTTFTEMKRYFISSSTCLFSKREYCVTD